jgi:hypothetical protein
MTFSRHATQQIRGKPMDRYTYYRLRAKLKRKRQPRIDYDTAQLQWKLKQLGRQCGRQGRTIYELRCALAEVRGLMDKRERGELRVSRDVRIAHGMLMEENLALRRQVEYLTTELNAPTTVSIGPGGMELMTQAAKKRQGAL